MYGRNSWEQEADSTGFVEHSLETAGIVNTFWNNLDVGHTYIQINTDADGNVHYEDIDVDILTQNTCICDIKQQSNTTENKRIWNENDIK